MLWSLWGFLEVFWLSGVTPPSGWMPFTGVTSRLLSSSLRGHPTLSFFREFMLVLISGKGRFFGQRFSLLNQGYPSLIVGDFNCIIGSNEKRGSRQFIGLAEIAELRSFIFSAGVLNLGFSDPQFTWCNNRQGSARVWKRLDRAYL